MYGYSPSHNLEGYINNSLAVFNTSEYTTAMGPVENTNWPDTCRYRAYRKGPEEDKPYSFNQQFWHVFTARLAFILIFEHVVFLLTGAVAMSIPDVPLEVKNQMMREKKVEKETLFENEMKKIKRERQQGRQATSPEDDGMNVDLERAFVQPRPTPDFATLLTHHHLPHTPPHTPLMTPGRSYSREGEPCV
ncbi:hypothetical protein Pcinc_028764 [Petrolisthes cinctipes]|uniref:Anoctamin n=1 Tax=Petrolisthes cinctipes TaxID=88211 RepID=A0AAE1F1Q4_PETCI|nr:hypothetical protein Pcinc_028764 [Petrolisthes cinctipes]